MEETHLPPPPCPIPVRGPYAYRRRRIAAAFLVVAPGGAQSGLYFYRHYRAIRAIWMLSDGGQLPVDPGGFPDGTQFIRMPDYESLKSHLTRKDHPHV